MWTIAAELLPSQPGSLYSIKFHAHPATFAEVIAAWQTDESFRDQFNSVLADVPCSAFRWETPAVTSATLTRPFEFVVLDSPGLARTAEPEAFAANLANTTQPVVAFPNLSGDATLIVPAKLADPSVYVHLAAFVRDAPVSQRHALWHSVGKAMAARVNDTPVWLSTAGAGVPWLHVRLDNRPKYYGYAPYRQAP